MTLAQRLLVTLQIAYIIQKYDAYIKKGIIVLVYYDLSVMPVGAVLCDS